MQYFPTATCVQTVSMVSLHLYIMEPLTVDGFHFFQLCPILTPPTRLLSTPRRLRGYLLLSVPSLSFGFEPEDSGSAYGEVALAKSNSVAKVSPRLFDGSVTRECWQSYR